MTDWHRLCRTRFGMPIKEPRPPKVVHLVGMGPTRNLFTNQFTFGEPPPAFTEADAVWTLNRGVWFVPADLVFVMDHIGGEAAAYPQYGNRLWRHDKPIITSDNADGWPAHVHRYPWEEIRAWVRDRPNPPELDWIQNSFPFIAIFAAWLGVRTMFLWGIDYDFGHIKATEDGKANASYWLRFAEENGVRFILPKESTFLNADRREFFYGYQNDPRDFMAERRERFEGLIRD